MKRRHRTAVSLAAAVTSTLGAIVVLPLLAMGAGGLGPSDPCAIGVAAAAVGGTPIQGSTSLTVGQLTSWWDATGHSQPTRLRLPVADVIDLYLTEARAEGIRGDLALAQAIHETGWFENSDTDRNNFAGIAHHDDRPSRIAFPDVATGVRAHIQLLKKYATGNDTSLAHRDVAPAAGAHATTSEQLAGAWASDPGYWAGISEIHGNMLGDTGAPGGLDDCAALPASGSTGYEGSPGNVPLANVAGITVHHDIAVQVDSLLRAAAADGLTLTGAGYRDTARQIELRRAHCGTSTYAVYQAPSSACLPPTARPGTSMHELGLAIDFDNCSSHATACWQWLNANAVHYGLYNLPSEPWHWSANGT